MSPPKQPNRIFLSAPHMSGKELNYVHDAFASNYIAPVGPQLNQFEDDFRSVSGFANCVAVSNGTSAIHLVLRALGVGADDIVLGSTLTFIGSVAPVTYLNAELILIDSDTKSWNMDPHLLAAEIARLQKRGKKPSAVIPTELYGQPCDLDAILDICVPLDIPVICDSAESLGASYKGKFCGTGAVATTFSFNGNKIITTSGGGMIATEDSQLAERCRYLATQARQPVLHYEHDEVGYNYRMSNVIAAIGIGQLEVLADRVARKRQINRQYKSLLNDIEGLSFMPEPEYSDSNCWLTVMQINPSTGLVPNDVIAALEADNIESRPVWKPLHCQKAFQQYRSVGGSVAEKLFQEGVCLPSGTQMLDTDVERVAKIVRSVIAR
ncbi:MAG: DegT/DnrJ/EryC1/StrS family aminotransferase [Fuerstiella sp.]